MNNQLTTTTTDHRALSAGCRCCPQQRLLVAQTTADRPGRWATCAHTGLWHENRGDGVFLLAASNPTQRAADLWAEGGATPVLAPGTRIDLSRESYA